MPWCSSGQLELVGALLEVDAEVFLVLLGLGLVGPFSPLPFVSALALGGRDQLGQHAGERVDLVAAQLGARGELRRALAEHALEAEHQGVAHLPVVRGLPRAGLDLGERVVERAAAGGPGRERVRRILVRVEEGLSGPGFGAEGGGG